MVLLVSTNLLAQDVELRRWSSISVSYGIGGESEVNNISNADLRTNLLSAASVSYSISAKQGIKLVYLNSTILKDIGSNTHRIIFGYPFILKRNRIQLINLANLLYLSFCIESPH